MSLASRSVEAVFGSLVRGDCDRWSDRDLLLVEDDPSVAISRKGKLEQAGWSCSHYTWDRLNKLSASGSLFVQHLRQESILLSDPAGQLSDLLSDYRPKQCYDNEINRSLRLFELLEEVPDTADTRLWALDVLAVLFRSLSIPTLANHGIYVFGQGQIVEGLERLGLVSPGQAHCLRNLRRFKAAHRGRGLPATEVEWKHFRQLIHLVDSTFRVGLDVKKVPKDVVLDKLNRTTLSSDWYATSRRLELGLILTQSGPQYLDKRKQQLLSLLRAPTQYGGYLAQNMSKLQQEVYELARKAT